MENLNLVSAFDSKLQSLAFQLDQSYESLNLAMETKNMVDAQWAQKLYSTAAATFLGGSIILDLNSLDKQFSNYELSRLDPFLKEQILGEQISHVLLNAVVGYWKSNETTTEVGNLTQLISLEREALNENYRIPSVHYLRIKDVSEELVQAGKLSEVFSVLSNLYFDRKSITK